MSTSASHFRLKLICPFYFFLIIAKVHKAAGVSRKATKTRQKRFLSILLDYWISTAKFMFPLYGKERRPFFNLILQKERTQLKKDQGKLSLCLLTYGNQHSFHFFVLSFVKQRHACMHSLDPAKTPVLCAGMASKIKKGYTLRVYLDLLVLPLLKTRILI